MNNKNVFAKNLQKYMDMNNKSRRDVCEALGFSYYTFSDWVNGKKYPRMDKVEMLANYFGILKSDLIEEKITKEAQKNNDIMADIIVRMRTDEGFLSVVEMLYNFNNEDFDLAKRLLQAFK